MTKMVGKITKFTRFLMKHSDFLKHKGDIH